MISLFGTLDMAANSLSVQQEEMTITGQNLANVNNTAYADEQLDVSESAPVETAAGDEGTGIQVNAITESRNPLLDSQIQAETSTTGSLTAQQTNLQNAEAYLDEQITSTSSSDVPDSPNGLAAGLSNLFNSFQSLSTNTGDNPNGLSLRQAAVQSAQDVAAQFNQVSTQLSTVQSNLNTDVKNDVASSNQDLNTIATLNEQIVAAEAGGGTADQLVDQREQTLENLAGLANFSTTAEANGAINVSIGGVTMVSGGVAADQLETYDPGNGQLQVQAQNAGTQITLTGGSIAGEITARDGALASLQSGLNTLASQLITQVNSIYSPGYDLNGDTGQDLFTGTGAANMGVNSNVVNDPSQFQAAGVPGAAGDNKVVLALAALGNQQLAGLNNQTISSNYAQTVSDLGNAISSVTDKLNTSQAVSQMLSNDRAATSGVSLDGEMTNLIQYQKAYEASAEMITTLNEMLQTVVAMKTT